MGDSSDCWRCIHCEELFPTRAARNRHEDTVCEPVDLDQLRPGVEDWDEEDVFRGFHKGDE